ncbi:MAG: protein tyrosine phosphatase [Pirellulaceae bacterium]
MKPQQPLHLLFVCSRNQWRSPTAEKVYQDDPRVQVRSRGTTRAAVRTIGLADIQWADAILVMEPKHQKRLLADFPAVMRYKTIRVLDIPDEFQRMDPELVELIVDAVEPVIGDLLG